MKNVNNWQKRPTVPEPPPPREIDYDKALKDVLLTIFWVTVAFWVSLPFQMYQLSFFQKIFTN